MIDRNMTEMTEAERETVELYNTLFSEYGVTFLEGLGAEREDELALEFCRLAMGSPWDGVKVFTDKENSVYAAFPTEKVCLTEQCEVKALDGSLHTEERLSSDAAEKIAPHLTDCRLIVLDLNLFSEGEDRACYRRLSEALKLSELAERSNVNFLIPAHFEPPFSAWRNSVLLAGRHVRVVQLFRDREEYGMEIFGGKEFSNAETPLADTAVSEEEFEDFVDGLTENEGTMSAICASDMKFVRTMYELDSVEKIQAENGGMLEERLCALSAAPYDAYVIVLYIPQNALEKIVKGFHIEKDTLLATVKSERYKALIGCYRRK